LLVDDDQRAMLVRLCQVFPDADPLHIIEIIATASDANIANIIERKYDG
jgi:hypothetical protein